ncbi:MULTISPECIES: carbohydrate ABC transporter permease [Actinomadura]|uniref:ABC transporter permease subunit n=1 Tax=Actinomadura litoris TaxID=2678616 RepID=A0A7K1KXQ5_9ACTN|nr:MULTISPECIES: carbohydrate ABC transporter permease [Actinomadura]MBT2210842.1 carbohydrate ABC transporter permease [Actinomadura sp. NEAU-AAG7]MUN36736.1 ABC transporter permease subunit [Actinomadura litoris]
MTRPSKETSPAGAARRRPLRLRTALLTAVGWLVAVGFLLPYLQMALTSLKSEKDLTKSPGGYLPDHWTWSNFVDVWDAAPLWTYLRVSLIVAVAATVVTLACALPAAYYTARYRFRGRGAYLLLVLVTQMFAPTALVIGIYREMVALNLTDTLFALVLVNAAFNLPFCVWILHGYFSSIPKELEEAAFLDGAGRVGALTRVTLPISMPGVVTAVVYTFIAAWNEYIVALTVTASPDRRPLTVAVPSFVTQYQAHWQYLFASSLIAIVPVVILFVFVERYLIGGLTAGSVK